MDNKSNQPENTRGGSTSDTQRKFNIAGGQDLPDNLKDEEKMKPENMTIDLPDVEDIPGQENVKPMPIGELADTTISSDDEEGVGLFGDDDEDDELVIAKDSNVSMQEKKIYNWQRKICQLMTTQIFARLLLIMRMTMVNH
ncbi:MAG: hypothetical protein WKF59_15895 [Chitinophagaceae bacterium]